MNELQFEELERELAIYRRLKRLRHRYTYEEIGNRVGCSRQYVYMINQGYYRPDICARLDLEELREDV